MDPHLRHVLLVWFLLRDTHDAGLFSAHRPQPHNLKTMDDFYENSGANRGRWFENAYLKEREKGIRLSNDNYWMNRDITYFKRAYDDLLRGK